MPSVVDTDSISSRLKQWAQGFDEHLGRFVCAAIPAGLGSAGSLQEAVRYSVLAPGKRLRPYLVCRCCELCGGSEAAAYPIAAAVECVHAFSLVHDDLPAMDDDELRRGQPATHVRFGEATAILAGDALLALAFELVAEHAADAERARSISLELSRAVGAAGMIGGQAADISGESLPLSQSLAEFIHEHKTAKLFEAGCRIGGLLADGGRDALEALSGYGLALGRAFQIVDDVLDVTASSEHLGKKAGKDSEAGKQTLARCVGIEECRRIAAGHVDRAIEALGQFGEAADDLRDLARFVLERGS
jgi:geranylgeranyl diphosphate synthase type II